MTATPPTLEIVKSESDTAEFFQGHALSFGLGNTVEKLQKNTAANSGKRNEVIRSEDDPDVVFMLPEQAIHSILKTESAVRIARAHYTKEIIAVLNWISENHVCGKANAMSGFSKLFRFMNDFVNKSPKDPFTSLARALYQGLVFEDNWINTDPKVFKELSIMMTSYSNRNKLKYNDIDKALLKLEGLGINPTPF